MREFLEAQRKAPQFGELQRWADRKGVELLAVFEWRKHKSNHGTVRVTYIRSLLLSLLVLACGHPDDAGSVGTTVLFGGYGEDYENDTWEWDGTQWTEFTLSSEIPRSRVEHAMTYDASRNVTLLFGGIYFSGAGRLLDDMWEWNGSQWAQIPTSDGAPTPRQGHAMIYDAERSVAVLFGGAGGSFQDDTWEWNGSSWSEITLDGAAPTRRYDHAMAYDATRSVVVLFGGFDQPGQVKNDTWEWDGSQWTDVTPSSSAPTPRQGHAMAYDVRRSATVLFGGTDGLDQGDTWEWDGSQWTEVTPNDIAPTRRHGHSMTYDAERGVTVLFGGSDGLRVYGDTWEWDGKRWTQITPSGDAPTPRVGAAMSK